MLLVRWVVVDSPKVDMVVVVVVAAVVVVMVVVALVGIILSY